MPVVYQWHAWVCVRNPLIRGSLVLEDLPFHTNFSRLTKSVSATHCWLESTIHLRFEVLTAVLVTIQSSGMTGLVVVRSTDVSNEPRAHFVFTARSFKTSVTICQLIRHYNPEAIIFKILSLLMIRAFRTEARPWNTRFWSLALFLCRLCCWPQGSLGATCLSTSIIIVSFQTLNSAHVPHKFIRSSPEYIRRKSSQCWPRSCHLYRQMFDRWITCIYFYQLLTCLGNSAPQISNKTQSLMIYNWGSILRLCLRIAINGMTALLVESFRM